MFNGTLECALLNFLAIFFIFKSHQSKSCYFRELKGLLGGYHRMASVTAVLMYLYCFDGDPIWKAVRTIATAYKLDEATELKRVGAMRDKGAACR